MKSLCRRLTLLVTFALGAWACTDPALTTDSRHGPAPRQSSLAARTPGVQARHRAAITSFGAGTMRVGHTATNFTDGATIVAGGSSSAAMEIVGWDGSKVETIMDMIENRANHTATLLHGGEVIMAGGSAAGAAKTSTEIVSPITHSNGAGPSMNHARERHTGVLLRDGRVLVAGGADGATYLGTAEIYDPGVPGFADADSLGTARADHTANVLHDGRVLVCGGRTDAAPGYLKSCEIYSPATAKWTPAADMSGARADHTATVLADGRVLVAGGRDTTGPLAAAEIYDPAGGAWTATGNPLATPRARHSATLTGYGLVVVAGGDNGTLLAGIEVYDPAADLWTTSTATLGGGRAGQTATLLATGSTALVGGDLGTGAPYLELVPPPPVQGAWVAAAAMHQARVGHGAVRADWGAGPGVIVIGGGAPANGSVERYGIAGDEWSYGAASPLADWQHQVVVALADGRVLVAGGGQNDGGKDQWTMTDASYLYDPTLDTWTATAGKMSVGRMAAGAALMPDGRVLVAGGFDGHGIIISAEIFDPVKDAWSPLPPMDTGRLGATVTALPDGTMLVAGMGSSQIYTVKPDGSGYWGPPAPMPVSAVFHSATLLADGRVLVTGGASVGPGGGSGDGGYPTDIGPGGEAGYPNDGGAGDDFGPGGEVGHPADVGPDLDGGEPADVGPGFDGGVFDDAGAGYDGGSSGPFGGSLSAAAIYRPDTHQWRSAAPMQRAREWHASALLQDRTVLVAGGEDTNAPPGSTTLSSAEIYSPIADAWSPAAPLHDARAGAGAVVFPDGRFMLSGGGVGDTAIATVEIYTRPSVIAAPRITGAPASAVPGETITVTGAGFTGTSGTGGGGTNDSPVDHPVVFAGRVGSPDPGEAIAVDWSDVSMKVLISCDTSPGNYLLGVTVAGITSPTLPFTVHGAAEGEPCLCNGACVAAIPCFQVPGTCTASNVCHYDPLQAGSPCDDGDPCTYDDLCDANHVCAGTAYQCPSSSQCASVWCDGDGGCNVKTNWGPCDDGDQCTYDDQCQPDGTCRGASYSCTPRPCEETSACDGHGKCITTPKPPGVTCDPGNPCMTNAHCSTGGECMGTPSNPGAPCDDGNACTRNDRCDMSGHCNGMWYGPPPDGTPCRRMECDGNGGFTPVDSPAGSWCDDADPCTLNDRCDGNGACAGTPLNCGFPPPAQCVAGKSRVYNAQGTCGGTGQCTYTFNEIDCTACGGTCDDQTGFCSGIADPCCGVVCNNPPNAVCYDSPGTCTNGACTYTPLAATTSCDDGHACTRDDHCDGEGHCVGTAYACPPKQDCHTDPVCDGTGTCTSGQLPQGSPCQDDGLQCTSDTCDNGGVCRHTFANDGFQCFIGGECYWNGNQNPAAPCQYCDSMKSPNAWLARPEGWGCWTADPCFFNQRCTATGQCVGTAYSCPQPGQCDDSVQCDHNGGCTYKFVPQGTGCNDGNACTRNDACNGQGTCVGTAYACPAPTECQNAVTCDGTGGCVPDNKPPGASCAADQYSCTDDICDGNGGCTHPITAAACLIGGACWANGDRKPNAPCLNCDPAGSTTAWTAVAASQPCSDGNACTRNDACDGQGACVGTAYTCPTPTECQNTVACDGSGGCIPSNKPAGVPCAADNLWCTGDVCDGSGGCAHPIVPGSCLIGGKCFMNGERKAAGSCLACVAATSQTTWSALPQGLSCDDGNACTKSDVCDGQGNCAGTAYTCALGQCDTSASCDGAGGCTVTRATQGTTCNDGNACTRNDVCDGNGGCAGTVFACPTPTECQQAVTCDGSGGCTVVNKTQGTACGDDGLSCTDDVCDGSGACAHPIKSGLCVIDGKCWTDGDAKPGAPCVACVVAASQTAWSSAASGKACDDGNPCTKDDVCDGSGTCAGTAYSCPAPGQCQASAACDGTGGCTYAPKPAGTPCSLGDPCSQDDTCDTTGSCVSGGLSPACADAGTAVDGGTAGDGGTVEDGGGEDGGGTTDGGTAVDGGEVGDGGTAGDGAAAGDGAISEDGGGIGDGGTTADGAVVEDAGAHGRCGPGTTLEKGVCTVTATASDAGGTTGYGKCGAGTALDKGTCLPTDTGAGNGGCGCATVGTEPVSSVDVLGLFGVVGAALMLAFRRRA